jgi:hypothetical protein
MKFEEASREMEEIRMPHKSAHLILFIEFQTYNPLLLKSTILATKAK